MADIEEQYYNDYNEGHSYCQDNPQIISLILY